MPKKKVEHELMEYIPPQTSPQLKLHTLEYLYDTVGWALYCTGALDSEQQDRGEKEGRPKPASQTTIELGGEGKAADRSGPKRPVKRKKKTTEEEGAKPLKVKKGKWDELGFLRKSLKDIYRSKDEYLNFLREQYDRELQFYRAILRGERSYTELYPELEELGIFDSDMEEEVEAATREQLEELNRNLKEETRIINGISDREWEEIRRSPNPKISLALHLGAEPEAIRENFHSSLLVRMRAQRMGQRTAFYSWQGPTMWTGLEDFEVQVDQVVDAVLDPILAYESSGALETDLKRNPDRKRK